MCETLLNMMALDHDFQDKILWSDVSRFTLNGPLIRHNCVIWNKKSSFNDRTQHPKLEWRDGLNNAILSEGICGPHFFDESVNAENYLLLEWAPRSCDLTPCDFFLWGYLKHQVYRRKPTSIEQLKEFIREEIQKVPTVMCERVCRSVQNRLQQCLENDGKQLNWTFQIMY